MRGGIVGIALLAGMALAVGTGRVAWGQIAAPSLVPGTFSSENPAVIKWGAPSRFGGAYVAGRETSTPANQTTDFAGGYGGFRLVGETLAVGFETLGLQDQENNVHDERGFYSGALALQTGPYLAWGLGDNVYKQTLNATKSESDEPNLGISLRLGELWFIGGTVGRESASYKDQLNPAAKFDGHRDVLRGGFGFRRGGTVLMHFEAFAINRKDYETQAQGKFGGEETTGGTVEFTFWSFLIGGSARHTKVLNSQTDTIDVTSGDIGYAPRQGLTLTLHVETQDVQFKPQPPNAQPPTQKFELGAVLLTYLF